MFKNATLVLASIMALAASVAAANIPDLSMSSATIAPDANNSVLYNRINGDGYSFTQAKKLPGGITVDATITLTLLDALGNPIPLYPEEDIWLASSGNHLVFPAAGTIADAPTNYAGQTQWQQPLVAGGCTIGETTIVLVSGEPLEQAGLPLAFVSADINGDLAVNITDLSTFAAAYTVAYDACADLFYDGAINISDLSLFSTAYLLP